MKKIFIILTLCILSITGCSKQEESQSFEKYIEEGKMAIANQEYEKALNFFTLAKEEKEDEEVNSLYNQTNNLVEAIDSREKENYTVAIQLCETISKMESKTNIIKEAAEKLKKECNELMKKENNSGKKKEEQDSSNSTTTKTSQKQYYTQRLSQVERQVEDLENSPEFTEGSMMELRSVVGECFVKWDDLLNEIYGVLKAQLSESEMRDLKNKQRDWIKYRDSQADEAAAEYEGGTMAPLEYNSVRVELTRKRCYELVNQYMN